MSVITWLHLADLHFRVGGPDEDDQKIVLEALQKDIKKQIEGGLDPDFVFLTGDIAFYGKKEEYNRAIAEFFNPLNEIEGISKEKWFIVPGNHDINWEKILPTQAIGMRNLLEEKDKNPAKKVRNFLKLESERKALFAKFDAYSEFINSNFEDALFFDHNHYFYGFTREVGDYKIGIVGLNSAWMSPFEDDNTEADRGRLLIGEWQLRKAFEELDQVDIVIMLMHHPLDWLGFERANLERQIDERCDFLLHGHLHRPDFSTHSSLAGGKICIPTGAIFTDRYGLNSYNFVKLDLKERRGKIYFRRYSNRRIGWIRDLELTGDEGLGEFDFSLPEVAGNAIGEPPIPEPTLPLSLPPSNRKKILLVENKLSWHKVMRSMILPIDFDLRIAGSYRDARELLQSKKFDLVIVNLCLQSDRDLLGEQLLYDTYAIDPLIPCIVLTGVHTELKGLFDRHKNIFALFTKGLNDEAKNENESIDFQSTEFLEKVRAAIANQRDS